MINESLNIFRVKRTPYVNDSGHNELLVIERVIYMTCKGGKTFNRSQFVNANMLGGRMELDSSHQSSLDLSICSNNLHSEDDRAIGRKEVLKLGLGIGMTL